MTQNGTRTTRVQERSLRSHSLRRRESVSEQVRGQPGCQADRGREIPPRRAGARGKGGARAIRSSDDPRRCCRPRIGPRSQVEIHNAAQAASSKLCAVAAVRGAALWYAPREAAGPYRWPAAAGWGPAPAPIRLGLFWFSIDSAISTPGMHIAALGECRLP